MQTLCQSLEGSKNLSYTHFGTSCSWWDNNSHHHMEHSYFAYHVVDTSLASKAEALKIPFEWSDQQGLQ